MARPWGGGVLLSRGWLLVPAALMVVGAFSTVFSSRSRRRFGAVIGALGVQVVLRWPSELFNGFPSLAAAVALVIGVSAWRRSSRHTRRRAFFALSGLGVAAVVVSVPALVATLMVQNEALAAENATHAALSTIGSGSTGVVTTGRGLGGGGRRSLLPQSRSRSPWAAGGGVHAEVGPGDHPHLGTGRGPLGVGRSRCEHHGDRARDRPDACTPDLRSLRNLSVAPDVGRHHVLDPTGRPSVSSLDLNSAHIPVPIRRVCQGKRVDGEVGIGTPWWPESASCRRKRCAASPVDCQAVGIGEGEEGRDG